MKKENLLFKFLPAVIIAYVLLAFLYRTGSIDGDFLVFTGSYLAFIGTLTVSFITLRQSSVYHQQERERIAEERFHTIQPIFSLRVQTSAGLCTTPQAQMHPEHIHQDTDVPIDDHTFEIILQNNSYHPAKHVIVFGHYLQDTLSVSERASQVYVFGDDLSLVPADDTRHIHIINEDTERTNEGLPVNIPVYYEDIDGHAMVQEFRLKKLEEIRFYSLERTRQEENDELNTRIRC